jgi:hypothetical protein
MVLSNQVAHRLKSLAQNTNSSAEGTPAESARLRILKRGFASDWFDHTSPDQPIIMLSCFQVIVELSMVRLSTQNLDNKPLLHLKARIPPTSSPALSNAWTAGWYMVPKVRGESLLRPTHVGGTLLM